ncbi:hypothetical protein C8J57DRAFT_1674792, partial [Mycena rebaudengoi]
LHIVCLPHPLHGHHIYDANAVPCAQRRINLRARRDGRHRGKAKTLKRRQHVRASRRACRLRGRSVCCVPRYRSRYAHCQDAEQMEQRRQWQKWSGAHHSWIFRRALSFSSEQPFNVHSAHLSTVALSASLISRHAPYFPTRRLASSCSLRAPPLLPRILAVSSILSFCLFLLISPRIPAAPKFLLRALYRARPHTSLAPSTARHIASHPLPSSPLCPLPSLRFAPSPPARRTKSHPIPSHPRLVPSTHPTPRPLLVTPPSLLYSHRPIQCRYSPSTPLLYSALYPHIPLLAPPYSIFPPPLLLPSRSAPRATVIQ